MKARIEQAVREYAVKSLRKSAVKAKEKLLEPTRTWRHSPSVFVKEDYSGGNMSIRVVITDEIYGYLDEGTKIRYATMSKDFQPKTRVGSFNASAGAGYLHYVDKRVPKKGIDARGWTSRVKTEWDVNLESSADMVAKVASQKIDDLAKSLFSVFKIR